MAHGELFFPLLSQYFQNTPDVEASKYVFKWERVNNKNDVSRIIFRSDGNCLFSHTENPKPEHPVTRV